MDYWIRHRERSAAIHGGGPQKKSWIAAACGLAMTQGVVIYFENLNQQCQGPPRHVRNNTFPTASQRIRNALIPRPDKPARLSASSTV
jgi:hypothetical protein